MIISWDGNTFLFNRHCQTKKRKNGSLNMPHGMPNDAKSCPKEFRKDSMIVTKNCPEDRQLNDYVSGALPWSEHVEIESHLDHCHQCNTALAEFDALRSPVFQGMPSRPQESPTNDAIQKAVQQIKRLPVGLDYAQQERTLPWSETPLPAGTELGNYVIEGLIGSGGMGRVYQARHTRMNRIVALKVLAPHLVSVDAKKRFQREIELLSRMRHPNIVVAHDADEVRGIHFLVMEFIDGENLADYVSKNGPLPIPEAVSVLRQAAQGLAYAHDNGLIHRDIKPANLLRDCQGTVKVLDLGLARSPVASEVTGALTGSNEIFGTVNYMAPEQALQSSTVDQRVDIYSLGCTLYFLVTGKVLHQRDNALATLVAHRDGPLPDLCEEVPECPQKLAQLFTDMIAKRPQDRPASMQQVLQRLDETEPASIVHSIRRPWRRTRQLAAVAGLILMIALFIGFRGPLMDWMNTTAPLEKDLAKEDKQVQLPPPKIELVLIQPGTFQMGAAENDLFAAPDEKPQHEVQLTHPFLMGKYEVTRGQFAEVMDLPLANEDAKTKNLPISGVSWLAAVQFCNQLSKRSQLPPYYEIEDKSVRILGGEGYRLPTEAEWEYACRAGTSTPWYFGKDDSLFGDYEWGAQHSQGVPQPVGQKKANPWGLHDMLGNVPEWCWDRYDADYYKKSKLINPSGATIGEHRVFRGGHAGYLPSQATASARRPLNTAYGPISPKTTQLPDAYAPFMGSQGVGFRVVRSKIRE